MVCSEFGGLGSRDRGRCGEEVESRAVLRAGGIRCRRVPMARSIRRCARPRPTASTPGLAAGCGGQRAARSSLKMKPLIRPMRAFLHRHGFECGQDLGGRCTLRRGLAGRVCWISAVRSATHLRGSLPDRSQEASDGRAEAHVEPNAGKHSRVPRGMRVLERWREPCTGLSGPVHLFPHLRASLKNVRPPGPASRRIGLRGIPTGPLLGAAIQFRLGAGT